MIAFREMRRKPDPLALRKVCLSNVSGMTWAKMKVLALGLDMTMRQVLEEAVERHWQENKDKLFPHSSGKARTEVGKILQRMVKGQPQ